MRLTQFGRFQRPNSAVRRSFSRRKMAARLTVFVKMLCNKRQRHMVARHAVKALRPVPRQERERNDVVR
jgi:hypothetical protein